MYVLDPEVAAGLLVTFGSDPAKAAPIGDWRTRRANAHTMFADLWRTYPPPTAVATEDVRIEARDGTLLTLRVYRPHGSDSGAVLLYLHGGGMIMCDLDTHDGICREYAVRTGMPVVAVDYRLAPEHPFPTPVDDCMDALAWVQSQAVAQRWDARRIVVGGESAGGGLAAAVALRARDEGAPMAAGLLLIYPMLDDRSYVADPALEAVATWTYDDHVTAWRAYVGAGGAASPYATPLRADDVSGLPPTYLEVGEFDIFRGEVTEFARRLLESHVPLEFHLHPSVPHAFDLFAPTAGVSQRAWQYRIRAIMFFTNKI